jgi:penicillin-binding protein 2
MDYIKANTTDKTKDMRDNAWFVGFAPRTDPEIVVVAMVEHGVHGSNEAPIVRDVIKAYFDKKARLEAQHQQQTAMANGPAGALELPVGLQPPAPAGVGR